MKFSHSIQFNAVPEWTNYYISYSNLKKLIYTLEKQVNQSGGQDAQDAESPLLGGTLDPDTTFKRMLDSELEKVCSFYQLKETEIYGELDSFMKDEEEYQEETQSIDSEQIDAISKTRHMSLTGGRGRTGSMFAGFPGFRRPRRSSTMSASIGEEFEDHDSDDDVTDENRPLNGPPSPSSTKRPQIKPRSKSAWAGDMHGSGELSARPRRSSLAFDEDADENLVVLYDSGLTLKKRAISHYVALCELRSFIQLNKTGFSKALKKYDKTLDRDLRRTYMEKSVSPSYPFRETTMQRIDEHIQTTEKAYAEVVTKGDIQLAKRELRLHLREHVVWERNTVWRDMIGIERKAQAANIGLGRTLLGDSGPSDSRLTGDHSDLTATKEFRTPVGKYYCPKWLFSSTFLALVFICAIFVVLLVVPIMEKPEQQNCLAMLAFVSLLWATEVIPLFVTSMLIPFLVVVLRIMRTEERPHRRMESKEATKFVFAAMWTPVIMLLLGGFTIAAALSKYHIAKMMATFVLSKAGTRPRTVLLTNMFVGMVLSMWISNVAAPVLCFSIIQPLLRNLPADSNFSKALILGIALASNIGGAASPIASPQNIIALQNMHPVPGWGTWFFIALPVCILTIIFIWLLLLATFHPGRGTTIIPMRPLKDKFTGVQYFITLVTLVTVILWVLSHQLEYVFGDMGVIAIIPLVLFFGTGILTKEDFNNFLWTIIILAAGGLSLGKAVSSSGLLQTIANAITERISGFSLYGVLVVFATLILVMATFISHTVSALIILPLVQQVGASMDHPHPNLLVMGAALMCSSAMGLPTSGFPNMTAIMMEVPETGVRYLHVKHFLSRGIPASIIAFLVVITVGFGLMRIAGL